jgi:hypothetical protein
MSSARALRPKWSIPWARISGTYCLNILGLLPAVLIGLAPRAWNKPSDKQA